MLIINADDLGRNKNATDNILVCHAQKRITATSAMVFMEDSERAAERALQSGVDVGLHINFSEEYSSRSVPGNLHESSRKIRRFLKRSKYALLIFNPFLVRPFRHVFRTQYEEFLRLFGKAPSHLDGHQHMHLASNMLFQGILPKGTKVRRSFSFGPGEKSSVNRYYRAVVDRNLAKTFRTTDYFFSLAQHQSNDQLGRVVGLAAKANVELMVHPEIFAEYNFLMSNDFLKIVSRAPMGSFDSL